MNDTVGLEAIGICEPDEFLSSDAIESELQSMYERLKLPLGRIEMQTGIKTRGVFKDKLPSDISTKAARDLFSTHGIGFGPAVKREWKLSS